MRLLQLRSAVHQFGTYRTVYRNEHEDHFEADSKIKLELGPPARAPPLPLAMLYLNILEDRPSAACLDVIHPNCQIASGHVIPCSGF
jgi:hypothetical protein